MVLNTPSRRDRMTLLVPIKATGTTDTVDKTDIGHVDIAHFGNWSRNTSLIIRVGFFRGSAPGVSIKLTIGIARDEQRSIKSAARSDVRHPTAQLHCTILCYEAYFTLNSSTKIHKHRSLIVISCGLLFDDSTKLAYNHRRCNTPLILSRRDYRLNIVNNVQFPQFILATIDIALGNPELGLPERPRKK